MISALPTKLAAALAAQLAAGAKADATPAERLRVTLCLALLLHLVLVLITFAPEDEFPLRYEPMEITLTQQRGPPPKNARALAQADSIGGGGGGALTRPPSLPGDAAAARPTPSPRAQAAAKPRLALEDKTAPPTATTKPRPDAAPEPRADAKPSAAALLLAGIRLAARETRRKQETLAGDQGPRRKFISASVRAYKYAAYMEAWRAKVERIGTLNYPEEARRRNINGGLILEVALNPDGSVNQIVVRRSSGHRLLDDAAIRIVRLAAPFAPFPPSFSREIDVLHITRTWQFLDNRAFR